MSSACILASSQRLARCRPLLERADRTIARSLNTFNLQCTFDPQLHLHHMGQAHGRMERIVSTLCSARRLLSLSRRLRLLLEFTFLAAAQLTRPID